MEPQPSKSRRFRNPDMRYIVILYRYLLFEPSINQLFSSFLFGFSFMLGYHDVAITFLLVVGEELGYQIVERLSVSHLRDFMAPTMEQTVRLLQYIYPIFR